MIVDHSFVKDLGDSTAHRCMLEQINRAVNVVRTHDNIDIRSALTHLVFIFLSQTTSNHDLALAAQLNALFFPRLEPTETAVQLLIGVLTNTTGVENYKICVVFAFGAFHAVLLE
jgi:hypothetical protein